MFFRDVTEMKSPDIRRLVYSLKTRIGIWAKEMLGYTGFSPHDVIFNVDSILMQS